MEKVLNDQIVKQIREAFAEMQEPVQVLFFGSKESVTIATRPNNSSMK
jgi:hypothetical protein